MRWHTEWLALAVGLCPVGGHAEDAGATPLTLARDGVALLPIVEAAGATPAEQTAATELAACLNRVTGGQFATVAESALPPGAPGIFVGQTQFAAQHGVDPARLGPEESIRRVVTNRLILTGGRPRGTFYAVYQFLEDQAGCRWYAPWIEKVPQRPSLNIGPLDQRCTPFMKLRSHYTHLSDARIFPNHDGWVRFNARNRMNDWLGPEWGGGVKPGGRGANHSFFLYVPSEKYFAEHPEYFSLRQGKRVAANGTDGNQLCLTNPDVLRIVIAGVKEDIVRNPDGSYYSVSINDGGAATLCDCPECRKVAAVHGESGLLLTFVNSVADAIRAESPDKLLLTLAYNPTQDPPKSDIRARDNVIVYLCRMNSQYCYDPGLDGPEGPAHMAVFADWARHATHIWAWDYALMSYQRGQYFMPLTWMQDAQLKTAKRLGVLDGVFQENEIGRFEDSLYNQFYELNQWLFMKQAEDPDLDLDRLIDDYLDGVYGPAAPALRQYIRLLRQRLPGYPYRMVDWEFLRVAQDCFDRAETAVAADAELLDRVRCLRLGLDLAALLYRNNVVHSYLRTGEALARYPFPVSRLKARVLATLAATKHPYLTTLKLSRDGEGGRRGFVPLQDILKDYLELLCTGPEYAPLPEFARNLPPDRVVDLTGPLLGHRWSPMFVADPEAALGLAVTKTGDAELPCAIGTWTFSNRRHDARSVRAADVPGPGYHWYQGARHPWLGPDSYIYLTSSWIIQVHPWPRPAQPEQWDVHASLKFTGPAYPGGKADEPNGVRLDRVILVKADSAPPP